MRPRVAVRLAAAALVTSAALLALGTAVSATWSSFTAGSTTSDSSLQALAVAPPALTAATSLAAGGVQLTWTTTPTAAERPDLTFRYRVYRSNGTTSVLLNATPTAALSFTDTPPADGSWTYTVVATVSSFQSAPSNALAGLSDRVAPAIVIACGSGACAGFWYRAAVTVTLSATDAGTGVRSVTYSVDGVATTIGGSTAAFSLGDGAHSIVYSAADQAGNSSAPVAASLKVDSTPPAIAAVTLCDASGLAPPGSAGWIGQGTRYRVLATIADATSGVASATATVTATGPGTIGAGVGLSAQSVTCGGQAYSYASGLLTAPAALLAGATAASVAVTATDVAGNSGSRAGGQGVDDTMPVITSFKVQSGTNRSGQITASWTATDALAGLAGFRLVVYNAGTTNPAAQYPNPIVLPAGTTTYVLTLTSGNRYDLYLTAVDNAGNNSLASSQTNRRAP